MAAPDDNDLESFWGDLRVPVYSPLNEGTLERLYYDRVGQPGSVTVFAGSEPKRKALYRVLHDAIKLTHKDPSVVSCLPHPASVGWLVGGSVREGLLEAIRSFNHEWHKSGRGGSVPEGLSPLLWQTTLRMTQDTTGAVADQRDLDRFYGRARRSALADLPALAHEMTAWVTSAPEAPAKDEIEKAARVFNFLTFAVRLSVLQRVVLTFDCIDRAVHEFDRPRQGALLASLTSLMEDVSMRGKEGGISLVLGWSGDAAALTQALAVYRPFGEALTSCPGKVLLEEQHTAKESPPQTGRTPWGTGGHIPLHMERFERGRRR